MGKLLINGDSVAPARFQNNARPSKREIILARSNVIVLEGWTSLEARDYSLRDWDGKSSSKNNSNGRTGGSIGL